MNENVKYTLETRTMLPNCQEKGEQNFATAKYKSVLAIIPLNNCRYFKKSNLF